MVLMASEARKREEEEELERKHAEIRCWSCVCVRACGCVSRVSDVTDARLQDTLFGLAQVLAANTGQAWNICQGWEHWIFNTSDEPCRQTWFILGYNLLECRQHK
jgi:hypothetical protein